VFRPVAPKQRDTLHVNTRIDISHLPANAASKKGAKKKLNPLGAG
jgi:hypothetical protein